MNASIPRVYLSITSTKSTIANTSTGTCWYYFYYYC